MSLGAMTYRTTIWIVAALTLGIGLSETVFGLRAGSPYLVKDGLEWGYGAAIYTVAAFTYGRGDQAEFRGALVVAIVLSVGGLQGAYEIATNLIWPGPEDDMLGPAISSSTALLGSLLVAGLLARFRHSEDPLVEGAWLSARNDIVTSLLDIGVALSIRLTHARWPQTISDSIGTALAFSAAYAVARNAFATRRGTRPGPRQDKVPPP